MRLISILILSIVPVTTAQTGLNSLPEVEFTQLSQRDPNPLGEKALSINPTHWKHGETEHYSYQRAHGYSSKPHSDAIAAEEVIPLATLVRLTRPPSDRIETFYDESERLVRFLVATDKPSFLVLLDALGRHQPFETALPRIYPAKFATVATLEEKFREYAAKDFGTTLQQTEE